MPRKLEVFLLDENGQNPKSEGRAREIADADVDSMLAQARKILAGEDMAVRTVSFTPGGKVIAYAYPKGLVPKRAAPKIPGWQHDGPHPARRG